MRSMTWAIGIGVVALAMVNMMAPSKRKRTWNKAMRWTRNNVHPMSRAIVKSSKKMIREMAR